MKRRIKRKSSPTPVSPEVLSLLAPIAAFLGRSGIPESQLASEFHLALEQARTSRSKVGITRIGTTTWCAEIVDRWLRDPLFVNSIGKPKDLPLTGKVSLTELIRLVGANSTPKEVARFLTKFGTVKKTGKGSYMLVKRYMNYTVPGALPYEPNLEFLVDAVAASTRGLGKNGSSKDLFWIRAQNVTVPPKCLPEFLAYVRQRGLLFLQEVDDWLEQHAATSAQGKGKLKNLKRMGVGLFPFCTDN